MLALVILTFVSLVAATPWKRIRPTKRSIYKCVDVAGAVFQNGTPVQIWDCNGSEAQYFYGFGAPAGHVSPYTRVNFCLDAGVNPTDGSKVHLWTCYDGLLQQNWGYDPSFGTLRLQNTNLCLDLTDGSTVNGKQLQVWTCGGPGWANDNQVWYT